MALKDTWINKQNDKDIIDADDINAIASSVIALEEKGAGGGGVSPTVEVISITGGHRVTITDVNGKKTFDVMDGDEGRGIKTIIRTSGNGSPGTTDTYTVTYTDNDTTTFTVYNGSNGETPVRGTDYWTPEDIAAIKSYVDDAILGGAW